MLTFKTVKEKMIKERKLSQYKAEETKKFKNLNKNINILIYTSNNQIPIININERIKITC